MNKIDFPTICHINPNWYSKDNFYNTPLSPKWFKSITDFVKYNYTNEMPESRIATENDFEGELKNKGEWNEHFMVTKIKANDVKWLKVPNLMDISDVGTELRMVLGTNGNETTRATITWVGGSAYMQFYKSTLEYIPNNIDWRTTSSWNNTFSYCQNLKCLPLIDMWKATDGIIINQCTNLEDCLFYNIHNDISFRWHYTKLSREVLVRIFKYQLLDLTEDETPKTHTFEVGTDILAKLTDEDKKIATDKGWTLA